MEVHRDPKVVGVSNNPEIPINKYMSSAELCDMCASLRKMRLLVEVAPDVVYDCGLEDTTRAIIFIRNNVIRKSADKVKDAMTDQVILAPFKDGGVHIQNAMVCDLCTWPTNISDSYNQSELAPISDKWYFLAYHISKTHLQDIHILDLIEDIRLYESDSSAYNWNRNSYFVKRYAFLISRSYNVFEFLKGMLLAYYGLLWMDNRDHEAHDMIFTLPLSNIVLDKQKRKKYLSPTRNTTHSIIKTVLSRFAEDVKDRLLMESFRNIDKKKPWKMASNTHHFSDVIYPAGTNSYSSDRLRMETMEYDFPYNHDDYEIFDIIRDYLSGRVNGVSASSRIRDIMINKYDIAKMAAEFPHLTLTEDRLKANMLSEG